jgi:putative flippase GtrA
MIRRIGAHSATRFAIVGVANFIVSFVVFYAALRYLPALFGAPTDAGGVLAGAPRGLGGSLRASPIGATANVLAYLAGMLNSFALNRRWTFRVTGDTRAQALRFAIVSLLCLALSTGVIYLLCDVLGYPELVVWLPLTAFVVVLSYLGCRFWAFAPAPLRPAERH